MSSASGGSGPCWSSTGSPCPAGSRAGSDHAGWAPRTCTVRCPGPPTPRHLTRRATEVGADLRVSTTVTGVADDGSVTLTGPGGVEVVRRAAVLLATGAHERPRAADSSRGTALPACSRRGSSSSGRCSST